MVTRTPVLESERDSALTALLSAAGALRPTPGYINGHDYSQWHVEASQDLLLALSDLAEAHGDDGLAARLHTLSGPLCMEPLDAELTYESLPKRWCGQPVDEDGDPCAAHTPKHAAALGRCTYTGDEYEELKRICREPLLPGGDRCPDHHGRCRVIKLNGKVCGRPDCRVPKHLNGPAR